MSLRIGLFAPLALGACAVAPPAGPSVMALPGQGKSFEAFQQDDLICRQYATHMTGGESSAVAASHAGVGSALLGTALGAGVGAALGSVGGALGTGAAIGGAAGLLAGTAIGAGNAQATGLSLQQRYDVSYTQCMHAKGDTVQAPPPPAYAAAPYGYAPGYGYPPGYVGYGPGWYYGPVYGGPTVVVGGGWGWGYRRWHRPYW